MKKLERAGFVDRGFENSSYFALKFLQILSNEGQYSNKLSIYHQKTQQFMTKFRPNDHKMTVNGNYEYTVYPV